MRTEDIEAHLLAVCEEKNRLFALMKQVDSPLGEMMIKRLSDKLQGIRNAYSQIVIKDRPDRDIVMDLLQLILAEANISGELSEFAGVKKVYKDLDEYQGVCESIITEKKDADRRRR